MLLKAIVPDFPVSGCEVRVILLCPVCSKDDQGRPSLKSGIRNPVVGWTPRKAKQEPRETQEPITEQADWRWKNNKQGIWQRSLRIATFALVRFQVLRVKTLVAGRQNLLVWHALLVVLFHTTPYKSKTVKSATICQRVWSLPFSQPV